MSNPKSQNTKTADEAWWEYYVADGLADGMIEGSWVKQARAAFIAGWNARVVFAGQIPAQMIEFEDDEDVE